MHHRQARLLLTVWYTVQLFSVSHCEDQQPKLEVDEVLRRQERNLPVPLDNDVLLKDIDSEKLLAVNQIPVNVDSGQDANHANVESQEVCVVVV